MKIINKTFNGVLSFCECCDTYQLEFGNIYISLKGEAFATFTQYIKDIDVKKSVEANKHKPINRKIMLAFPIKNLYFCLNPQELEELRVLLFITKRIPEKYLSFLSSLSVLAN